MELLIYLSIGYVCMLILSFLRNKKYKFPIWQIPLLVLWMVIAGVAGTMILFYIESGTWGGTSFYGSLFLIPILFLPVAKIVGRPYGNLTDYCAPPICIMLFVMKIRCVLGGCCHGRVLFETKGGSAVVFPSQIAEAIIILSIMFQLISFEKKEYYTYRIYPMLFITYGATRFILNTFRGDLQAFVWILPAGHAWSIVSVVIGIIVLKVLNKKNIENG